MADYDIGAAFAAIEGELMDSMVRNLKRHRAEETKEGFQWSQWQAEQLAALEQYKRRNSKSYGARFRSINAQLTQIIRDSYSNGQNDQEATILDAILRGADLKRSGDTAFFRTNQRKLDALIKATMDDVRTAETAILRRCNDQYRKIIFNAQVYANTGAGTYESAVDMATRDFLAAGIQCVVYSNGARHSLADYADMAIRTAAKRAYLSGEGTKRQEWGVSTVIVNKRSNACPHCARFCGKVFIDDVWSGGKRGDGNYPLLSRAVAQGLYHPRCKDSHTTWFPELHEDAEPYTPKEIAQLEKAEASELRRNHARRQAEKYRRMAEHSLDPENQRKYGAKAEEWERVVLEDGAYEILPVNDASIDAVQEVEPMGWTKKAIAKLRRAHQELLRSVQKLPVGHEAGAVYDMDMELIEQVIGERSTVSLPSGKGAHIVIHTHPSGQTFTEPDIRMFVKRGGTKVLTAVGNNGKVYLIQKVDGAYNAFGFNAALETEAAILKGIVASGDMEAYVAEMNRFLKEAEQYGIYYTYT